MIGNSKSASRSRPARGRKPDRPAPAPPTAEWPAEWLPALSQFAALEPWIQQKQIELTAVPAPTHFEALRAEWMAQQWRALGLDPGVDAAGNVVAERPGLALSAPLISLSAHLDTAFPPGIAVNPERRDGRIYAPGISDNGSGLAALLALVRVLHDHPIATRAGLLFVANTGEEGEGDLKGMRHLYGSESALATRIGSAVVVDGPGCDQITTQALPSRRLRVVFEGPGGHSWSDLGRASAIHAAIRAGAALLVQIQPEAGRLGCNIGCLEGGSAVNAIAATAEFKLDLRALDTARIDQLQAALRRAVAAGLEQENSAALSGEVRAQIELIGERPGGELPAHSPLLRIVREVDARLGIAARIQRASTDANIPLSLGRPALRLGAGGSGGGIHTLQEWFDPAGRTLALRRIFAVALFAAGAGA